MNQLKQYEPKIIEPPTPQEKNLAHETHQRILDTIKKVKVSEAALDKGYVSLGRDIYEMEKKLYWTILGYNNWREYYSFLEEIYGKGKSQLYAYKSTVKTLSEYVDDETMLKMGINKAGELRKAVAATDQAPSEEILEQARDPKVTAASFREAVHKSFHVIDHNEKGEWFDLKGCYLTPGEKEELLHGFDLAIKTDPPIPKALPAHVIMKEVLLKLVREFISEYEWKSNQNPDGAAEIEWIKNGNEEAMPNLSKSV